jgi:molybdate transport system ATP-binding protein
MGLQARFRKQVDGFDLDIAFRMEAELAVIFGPSGAGKSMTLRLIAGLLKPDAGYLKLNDTILYDSACQINLAAQNRGLGYVFQNHSLFPHMTVCKNIMFGAKGFPAETQREMARSLMTAFRLEGLEHKYPNEISGGQQQRVAFARAIIKQPQALLLDEPFSALDTPTRVNMRECLREVMKRLQIPIILVTHDIFEACAMADKMLIYLKGRIIQEGMPADILRNPATKEVAALTSVEHYRPLMMALYRSERER